MSADRIINPAAIGPIGGTTPDSGDFTSITSDSATVNTLQTMLDARIDFQHSGSSINSLGLNYFGGSAYELGFRPVSSGSAFFDLVPNGSQARGSVLAIYNNDRVSDPSNFSGFVLEADSTSSFIAPFAAGSSPIKPFDIFASFNGVLTARFSITGGMTIGGTVDPGAGGLYVFGDFYLRSPDGSRWKINVSNTGEITASAA